MAVSFKGAHFPQDIILTCVRWYASIGKIKPLFSHCSAEPTRQRLLASHPCPPAVPPSRTRPLPTQRVAQSHRLRRQASGPGGPWGGKRLGRWRRRRRSLVQTMGQRAWSKRLVHTRGGVQHAVTTRGAAHGHPRDALGGVSRSQDRRPSPPISGVRGKPPGPVPCCPPRTAPHQVGRGKRGCLRAHPDPASCGSNKPSG